MLINAVLNLCLSDVLQGRQAPSLLPRTRDASCLGKPRERGAGMLLIGYLW